MPHTKLLLLTVLELIQAVLAPHPLPPPPVKEPINYVIDGLPFALDELIISTIFQSGDLTLKQIETLILLFKKLDTYFNTLTNLLQKIKALLPVTGTNDNNKVARLLLVTELKNIMNEWAKTRQDGLQMAAMNRVDPGIICLNANGIITCFRE